MPTNHELSDRYESLAADTRREEDALRDLVGEIHATRQESEAIAPDVARSLATAYLPVLDAPTLAEAEKRTGFRGFSRFHPLEAMARERGRLEREIALVRADEQYVRREYLVGPNGSITRRLAEARDLLDPWQRECDRFERLPLFTELVESRYDTDHFERRWWEPAYWRLWKAGDAVCATLGLADFGDDVLPAYEKVREPRDQWRGQVAAIELERDAVHELVRRHDADVDRLARLPEIYHEEAITALAEHLADADPALLEQWSEGDRAVVMKIRRLACAAAKIAHLRELEEGVRAWSATLAVRRQEMTHKAAKYRNKRRVRHYDQRSWPVKPALTLQKSAARRARVARDVERVRRYDDHATFDVQRNAPELWWVEFTGGSPPVWTPGLRDWYLRQPNVDVHHDGDEDDAHAAAVAGTLARRRLESLGDLS